MTTFAFLLDAFLALTAGGMLTLGKFGVTRQLALAPVAVAALDAAFARLIRFSLTPVLSVLLVLLQLTVLCGSAMVLYQDRVRARNKENRRRRRREMARTRAAFEQKACGRDSRTPCACA